jgi:hypothetical protein
MQPNKVLVSDCRTGHRWMNAFSIARKAALALLVDEETELLATIDRYKTDAHKYNKEVNIQRFWSVWLSRKTAG